MSFITPYQSESFLVDRVTSSGKVVRRVIIVLSDGAIIMCKPTGVMCRIMHAGEIAGLIVAPWQRIANVGVLIRFDGASDLLFRHIMPARSERTATSDGYGIVDSRLHSAPNADVDYVEGSRLLQTAQRFLDCLEAVRQTDGHGTGRSVRASLEELVGTADFGMPAGRQKPQMTPITGTMLLPTIFDQFEIRNSLGKVSNVVDSYGHALPEPVNMFVDISFIAMLSHAVDASPLAGTTAPLLTIEAPNPFKSVVVNDKFFEAFTAAYCSNMSLIINVHGPLPHLVSFRSSPAFWQFARKRNQGQRPAPRTLRTLEADHIEAYIAGEEAQSSMCMPVVDWNQTVVDWELQVRSRTDVADEALNKSLSTADPNEAIWASFVHEAYQIMNRHPAPSQPRRVL